VEEMGGRRLNEDEEAILDVLCEKRHSTTSAIATRARLTMAQVDKALRFLVYRRYCETIGYDATARATVGRPQAIWAITDAGRQAATTPNPAVWQREPWGA
jgi:predicted ArsR family transcriptional regulator